MNLHRLQQECAQRGLRVERRGSALRITGPGLCFYAADARFVSISDLEPKGDPRPPDYVPEWDSKRQRKDGRLRGGQSRGRQ